MGLLTEDEDMTEVYELADPHGFLGAHAAKGGVLVLWLVGATGSLSWPRAEGRIEVEPAEREERDERSAVPSFLVDG